MVDGVVRVFYRPGEAATATGMDGKGVKREGRCTVEEGSAGMMWGYGVLKAARVCRGNETKKEIRVDIRGNMGLADGLWTKDLCVDLANEKK